MRWMFLPLLLGACAPGIDNPGRVDIDIPVSDVAYHPFTTVGLERVYLEANVRLDRPPIREKVEGQRIVDGKLLHTVRRYGRGDETINLFALEGGFLSLHRHDSRGLIDTITLYDPPVQYLPEVLEVGRAWRGEATESWFQQQRGEVAALGDIELTYEYTVVGKRTYVIDDQQDPKRFETYVISARELRDDQGTLSKRNYEFWYTPFVGVVRTRDGKFLIDRNFGG